MKCQGKITDDATKATKIKKKMQKSKMADDAEEARASRGGGEETGNWSKNQQQVILIWIETGDHYD